METNVRFPSDIILQILKWVNLSDIPACLCVCHYWAQITNENNVHFWKSLCKSDSKLRQHSWKASTYRLLNHKRFEKKTFVEYSKQLDSWKSMFNMSPTTAVPPSPAIQEIIKITINTEVVPFLRDYTKVGGFDVHPSSSPSIVSSFGMDLCSASKDVYCFVYSCKARDRGTWTMDPIYIKGAMERYCKFMLLKRLYPDTLLIPTLDIEYIWRSHMIRPEKYKEDCLKHFSVSLCGIGGGSGNGSCSGGGGENGIDMSGGSSRGGGGGLIPHKIRLSKYETLVRATAIKETSALWKKHYHETYGGGGEGESSAKPDVNDIDCSEELPYHEQQRQHQKQQQQPLLLPSVVPGYMAEYTNQISGSWVGVCYTNDKRPLTLCLWLSFSPDRKIYSNKTTTNNTNNINNNREAIGEWCAETGCVSFRLLSSIKNQQQQLLQQPLFNGVIKGSVMEGTIHDFGKFFISRQTIPSGVWEGYVRWVSGNFNGQTLNHVPEKMRVFLVFDEMGNIYGGGTQRNDYFKVRICGSYNPKTGNDIRWTKVTLQKSTGAMNGCNNYEGLLEYNASAGCFYISGSITRKDTNWKGVFLITFLGSGTVDNDEEDTLAHQWVPHPTTIKVTNEVSYHEILWRADTNTTTKSSSTLPCLGITVEDVVSDSSWLDKYCSTIYSGFYCYPSDEHLQNSLKDYEKLLFLCAKYPQQRSIIRPSYSIDLIWQTHQMHPQHYHNDCKRLVGYELDYQPIMQQQQQQQQQNKTKEKDNQSQEETEILWKKEFMEKMDIIDT